MNTKNWKQILYCEACEKDINNYFKAVQFKSIAHEKRNNNFGKKWPDWRKICIDDRNVYQLHNIAEKAFEVSVQKFRRFKYKCEEKNKIVLGDNGKEKILFKLTNSCEILHNVIDEQVEIEVKSPEMRKEKVDLLLIA